MSTIKYLAGDGKTVLEIKISEYLDQAIATSYVNGKFDFSGRPVPPAPGAPAVVAARLGSIGLKQDRYDEVMAAITALQSEIDARPAVQMRKLIERRERLAAQIGYILEDRHEEYQARIEQTSATGVYQPQSRDYESDEGAARQALADFDAAHPDVVAKVTADKQTVIAEFLAND